MSAPGWTQKELVEDLKKLIIRTLRLEDVTPEDIADSEPLFGSGLGLDSIDALELVVAIERDYGIMIPDAEVGRRAFASIEALADFVLEKEAMKRDLDAVG